MKDRPVIAVGAVGGSGTRVVAEILSSANVFMGDDLNDAMDNLVFTRLFRDPSWYKVTSPKERVGRWKLFCKYMSGQPLTLRDRYQLLCAVTSNKHFKTKRKFWVRALTDLPPRSRSHIQWGWKEPNTQIYINEVLANVPSSKYVHVLRNGLDMAFSGNKRQIRSWGWLYDIQFDPTDPAELKAQKMFDYWKLTTKNAMDVKAGRNGDKIYIVRFENLFKDPEKEIRSLLKFCEIQVEEKILQELTRIPNKPSSYLRYLDQDLSFLTMEDRKLLEWVGYPLDSTI